MYESQSIDYKALGQRVRARRRALALTQEALAERIEASTSFVGHIERGEKVPSLDTMSRISAALDLSLDYLVFGQKNPCAKAQCALYDDLRRLVQAYT